MDSNSNETNFNWQKDIQTLGVLPRYMKGLRQQIGVLAREDNDAKLIQQSELLRRAKGISLRVHSLAVEAEILIGGGEAEAPVGPTPPRSLSPQGSKADDPTVTRQREARARGEVRRKEYVERQLRAGVNLSPWRGALYKKPDGRIVGIAYASERRRKNFWFLGLPKDEFDEAVLLCEADGSTMLEVSLSTAFFAKYGSKLGASQAGQTHFQVERRSRDVYVRVPTVGPVNECVDVHECPIDSAS